MPNFCRRPALLKFVFLISAVSSTVASADDNLIKVSLPRTSMDDKPYLVQGYNIDVIGIRLGDTIETFNKQIDAGQYKLDSAYKTQFSDGAIINGVNYKVIGQPYDYYAVYSKQTGSVKDIISVWITPPSLGQRVYHVERKVIFEDEKKRPKIKDIDKEFIQKYGEPNETRAYACWTFASSARKPINWCNDYTGYKDAEYRKLEAVIFAQSNVYSMDNESVMSFRVEMFDPAAQRAIDVDLRSRAQKAVDSARSNIKYSPEAIPKL